MAQFTSMTSRSRAFGALLIAGFMSLAACDTEGGTQLTDPPGSAPPLPAATSMDIDFGLFQSASSSGTTQAAFNSAAELGAAFSATQLNFGTAALSVLVAQAVTVLHLAIPTAVFAAAANNTPSFEDGRWHWRYTASHAGQLWTAHLSGVVDGADVDWEMRITAPQSNPPLDDFLWYGGLSRTDGTSGTWRFYDPNNPAGSGEVARVDWTHESNDVHGVTFTVVSGENVGDMLTADHDGSTRLVTWTDASAGNTVEILWDVATGEGYIIAPNFRGGVKSCWDGGQNDVPCS